MTDLPQAHRLRVVSVGIGSYENFSGLPGAEPQAKALADLLGQRGADAQVVDPADEATLWRALGRELPFAGLSAGDQSLILYWAGHGYLQAGPKFCLAATDSDRHAASVITAELLADLATRTAASNVLLVIDACFAGAGALDAISTAMAIIKQRQQHKSGPFWFGVIASALDWEQARDELFGPRFFDLLRGGPSSLDFKQRWTTRNQYVYGADLIDALKAEWPNSAPHRPDAIPYGDPVRFIPNPLFIPLDPAGTEAQLLDAARGGHPAENGTFFTGRQTLLRRLTALIDESPAGIRVLTGPAGCGKSAVLGWLVCMADPHHRHAFASSDDVVAPPLNSIHANVVAGSLSPTRLVTQLDSALSASLPLPDDRAGQRGVGELVDAIRLHGSRAVVIVDGLDEAGTDSWAIAQDVLRPLAAVALILVGTRDVHRAAATEAPTELTDVQSVTELRPTSLVGLLAPDPDHVLSLQDLVDDQADIRAYLLARLQGHHPDMDAELVADFVDSHLAGTRDGRFLYTRMLASELIDRPVSTSDPGWEERLADSVEESFDATVAALPGLPGDHRGAGLAGRELFAALAWAARSGMPDDVWARVASELSSNGTAYKRTDVYWLLRVAGRFIVQDGNDTQAVYRLAHRQLVDHLRTSSADQARAARAVATAVTAMLGEFVDQGRDPQLHTYLWQSAWLHCADAGDAGIYLLERLAERSETFQFDLALALKLRAERLANAGETELALPLLARSLELLQRLDEVSELVGGLCTLALLRDAAGDGDAALEAIESAVDLARSLDGEADATHSRLAEALATASVVRFHLGEVAGAIAAGAEAVRLFYLTAEANPIYRVDLAAALTSLAGVYRGAGQPDDALRAARDAERQYRQLANEEPALRPNLVTALNNVGLMSREAGRSADGLGPAEAAVELGATIAAADENHSSALAQAHTNLSLIRRDLGDVDGALSAATAAVYLLRGRAHSEEEQSVLGYALNNLAVALRDAKSLADARDRAAEAVEALDGQGGHANRSMLATALGNLALITADLGRVQEALGHFRFAMSVHEDLASANPATPGLRETAQATNADNLAMVLLGIGAAAEGLPIAEQAVQLLEHVRATQRAATPQLCIARSHLALHYAAVGRAEDALRTAQEALTDIRPAVDSLPPDRRPIAMIRALASATNTAAALFGAVNPELGVAPAEESVALYRVLRSHGPFGFALIDSLLVLAGLQARLGDHEQAGAIIDEVLAAMADGGLDSLQPTQRARLLETIIGVGSLTHDPRVGAWVTDLLSVATQVEGDADQGAPDMGRTIRSRALGRRASIMLDKGEIAAAMADAAEAVSLCRSAAAGGPTVELATALSQLSQISRRADYPSQALAAAQEAVTIAQSLPVSNPQRLAVLATATAAWSAAVPTPTEAGQIWGQVYASLPDDQARLSLLLTGLAVAPESIRSTDVITASTWVSAGQPMTQLAWRNKARMARAADRAAFDAEWQRLTGSEPPDWLLVDVALQQLVEQWVTRPTVEETLEVHRQHEAKLESADVDILLAEIELANPQVESYRSLRDDIAEVGLEQAYLPLRIIDVVSQLTSSDPVDWPAIVEAHRELLTEPEAAEFLGYLDDGAPAHALLTLAAHDEDREVLGCLGEADRATTAIENLGDEPVLVEAATRLLGALGAFEPDRADALLVYRSIALAELDRLPEAKALAQTVADHETLDPASVRELIVERLELGASVQALLPYFPRDTST